MKHLTLILFLLFSTNLFAGFKPSWITIGSDVLESKSLNNLFYDVIETKALRESSVVSIDEGQLPELSERMHEEFGRCGGFVAHDSLEEAFEYQNRVPLNPLFVQYTVDQQNRVTKLIDQVAEKNLSKMITKLSSFKNRFYTSPTGVEASGVIYEDWKALLSSRSDAQVEKITHTFGPQNSVVATIVGEKYPDEIVVIGGHLDSTAGMWGSEKAKAPGADDNASGISVITETMRVLVENNYKPARTIKFMGYAAEEVGLRGSKAIAEDYRKRGLKVIGAIQFDMTNFKGSDLDIVMMRDYTNEDQNQFVGMLIDEYVKVPWGYDSCGYGCSDHASWTAAGFSATVPFESKKRDMNPNIHSSKDLLSVSKNADHSVKFTKLAIAYVVELAK